MSELLAAGGAAGAAMRAIDWSRTALGRPEDWPLSLVAHVRAMLHTRQPICIFWGRDFVNLYNEGFLPILGEKHPSSMGQSAREVWADAWPVVGAQLESVMRGQSVFHEEMLVPIARQGVLEDAWFNYSYSPMFADDGGIGGVLVICTEITREVVARRALESAKRDAERARENLEGVFMQSPVPMAIVDGADHRFRLANRPYLDFVGRPVVGRTVREAFTEEEVGYYVPIMDRVFQTGIPVDLHDSSFILAGEQRYIDVGYYPHREADGTVAGVMVVALDVTAKVKARHELEAHAKREAAAREHAESANRAKDEFLATVSHELRTPLSAMLGWARILRGDADPALLKKGLAVIERNAQAQAKLIDDILDVARIVSGKLQLEVARIDTIAAIQAAVESVRPAASAKRITLVVETSASPRIEADDARFQQIVWNLLANAVKFTPEGGEVRLRTFERDDRFHLAVSDNGRGITPSFLPHVFDRFRQDDSSTTKQHPGLGLGLAIVRHLAELHGGTVEARSDGEGHGATFEVVLPVGEKGAAVVEAEPSSPSLAGDRASTRALKGACVLVVEDQRDGRELVALVLESAGARVIEASSAETALDVLATTDVSAIVSDVGMPGQDGYRFIERVRSSTRNHDAPALALTAFARAEDRERAIAAGFQDHVPKPIDPTRLVKAVAALLG